ncbi:MAG: hypothetical protein ACE5I9_09390, partial [Candidatus Methylomirabilales bacterium]
PTCASLRRAEPPGRTQVRFRLAPGPASLALGHAVRPTGGVRRAPSRPQENFATDSYPPY